MIFASFTNTENRSLLLVRGCSFSYSLLVKDIKDLSLKWYVVCY